MLQVHGIVEHVLTNVSSLLRQDDLLKLVAVVEHIFIHHVVFADEVVHAMTLVRMDLVFLQARVI